MNRKIIIGNGRGLKEKYTAEGNFQLCLRDSTLLEETFSKSIFDKFWQRITSFDFNTINEQFNEFKILDGSSLRVDIFEDDRILFWVRARPCCFFNNEIKGKYKELFDFSKFIEENLSAFYYFWDETLFG